MNVYDRESLSMVKFITLELVKAKVFERPMPLNASPMGKNRHKTEEHIAQTPREDISGRMSGRKETTT